MKPATRNAYARRVDAVLAHLQAALLAGGDLPTLDDLASAAQLSPFHFHRVWRALTGETVGGTVARLRLLRALQLLDDPSVDIIEVALAVGYESPQALARATRDRLGASPSELRGAPGLREAARTRLERPGRDPVDAVPLQVEVVSLAPFEVVALRNRGAFSDLDRAYGALFEWAVGAGLAEAITGLHGIPRGDHRDVPPADLEFDCAIRLSRPAAPPPPLHTLKVEGGLHARVHHVGSYDLLEDHLDRVLADWLSVSGHTLRDAPIRFEFLDDPEVVPGSMLRADILVPLAAP